MGTLYFGLLGPVCAWRDGVEIDLGPGKQRAVLAVLLLQANRPVPINQIVDAVWGDEPPGNGPNVVQKHVSGLRRALEPERRPREPGRLLTLTDAGYTVRVEAGGLDIDVFRAWVDQASGARAAGALPHAAATLRCALAQWRGPALAGLSGEFFDGERDRLTEFHMGALEECLELEARLGRHVQLVPELTALIGAYPFRERLRGLLMTALHRSGRQAEALAAYREARRFLVEELGTEPGDELQQVHRQILEQVAAPAAPAAAPVQVMAPAVPQPGLSPAVAHPWGIRLGTWWLPLLPLLSLGFLSWAAAGYGAIRLRSVVHGLIAGAYFALVTVAFVVSEDDSWLYSKDVATLAVVLCWVSGTGQGLLLRYRVLDLRASLSDPLVRLARERTTRRQGARHILAREPAVARDLRIGRPDLPREYDDGGLVDINHVPEQVLVDVLGIGPEQACRIVAERERTGGFWSIEEIVGRGLLPEATARALAEILVVIR